MEKFNQYIDELRKHYKIQGEIKSTKTIVKKNKIEIMNQLYDKQAELNCNLVVEIVDKKFCMVERIIDYCVIPYYESPSKNHLSVNDMFARKTLQIILVNLLVTNYLVILLNFLIIICKK